MKGKMEDKSRKGLTTTQKILVAGFACIIVAIAAVGFFLYRTMQPKGDENVTTGNLVVDESNLASVAEDLQSRVDDSMFEMNMNTVWNFPDGGSASNDAYVANASGNHYAISFEVILEENENIFTSGVIPVGNRIKEIKLDKDLPAGTYDAVCMYHLLKEDGTENSSFGVNIIININE